MGGDSKYVPPAYIPLEQEEDDDVVVAIGVPAVTAASDNNVQQQQQQQPPASRQLQSFGYDPTQWSSGICACCDDMQSCCIGAICPCFLFGKNAEFLGSGTLAGSCMTHFILWGFVNSLCCLCTGGLLLVMPGFTVACYACGYRKALRAKYNLQEAPCGDATTHLFCHQCAICQEYREIRERSNGSIPALMFPAVTAPNIQTMELPKL